MERSMALSVAANFAQIEHMLCRLEQRGFGWNAVITDLSGNELYRLETDDEADDFLAEMWGEEEDEEE
jgi:hypothetical protein